MRRLDYDTLVSEFPKVAQYVADFMVCWPSSKMWPLDTAARNRNLFIFPLCTLHIDCICISTLGPAYPLPVRG